MTNVLVNPVPGDANVVVASRLAARQWEIFLARHALAAAEPVWLTPNVASFRDWAESLYTRSVPAPDALLTRPQSLALWRRVIDDSDAGRGLISSRAAAQWAAEASALLSAWNVDTAVLEPAPGDEDFRAFLSWHEAYRSQLGDSGWIDDADLDRRIAGGIPAPAGPIVLCDGFEPTPVQRSMFDRWRDAGHPVLTAPVDGNPAATCHVELHDEVAEIGCAARWAAARVAAEPNARVALVVPELERRQAVARRRLDEAFAGARTTPAVYFQSAGRLVDVAAVDVALAALEMLLPERSCEPFRRWLRKLVVHSGDSTLCSEAALLEARLRGDLRSQLGFVEAYRGTGLAGLIRREAPGIAAIVDPAVAEAAGWHRHRTPTLWGSAWQQSLRQLGWTASPAALDPAMAESWERALTEFEQLTPVTGPVAAARAFEELKATLGRRPPAARLPLSGIHVLDDVDSIGPGYAAAWVSGLDADRWPEGSVSNPLLPRRLQTAHRMPGSSPALALERSLRRLNRAASRVDTLVLSSPRTRHESRAEPSALIARFVTAVPESLGVEAVGRAARGVGRTMQWIDDPAPPLTGTALGGGARTLDLQAACPLRAFCESRLGAKPLEPVEQGLPRRLRGIATHRALERLLVAHPSRDHLQRLVDTGAADALRDAAEHGLKPYFGPVRRTLGRLLELERERLIERLGRLLRAELDRLPFELDAAERKHTLVVGRVELGVRIDRVDRLADGSLAVLDYKTGGRAGMPDWFGSRLGDTQLPVYALERGDRVAALAVVALEDARNPYKGTWRQQGTFPGRSARLPDGRSFEQQTRIWRDQIDTLVAELAAGDTRIFTDRLDAVTGDYAPLTRVYEQLAKLRREADA